MPLGKLSLVTKNNNKHFKKPVNSKQLLGYLKQLSKYYNLDSQLSSVENIKHSFLKVFDTNIPVLQLRKFKLIE